jgi:SagB-type dehydrogenase family enzyme
MTAKSVFFSLLLTFPLLAEMPVPVSLPKPETNGGKPLMQALSERRSGRDFASRDLSLQMLSNLLWAAFGVNRPDGHRTAPSAMNRQTIDVYVVRTDGAHLYDAVHNQLTPVAATDLRAATGTQAYVGQAPLNLVYVSDYSKMGNSSGNDQAMLAGAETGFIGQNVYLYCASEGLATVIRGSIDKDALAKALKLKPGQHIVLAQTVGYPASHAPASHADDGH